MKLASSFRAQRGICIALFIAVAGATFGQDTLPTGWRRPTPAEASGEWRQKSTAKFLVAKGDFDGDGKLDTAELLVNPSTKQFAMFVKLSSARKWQLVGQPFDLNVFDRFGIALVRRGKYKTACGKGYGDYACAHGEPDFLKVSTAAIDFFYMESSDSIFYWDPRAGKFVEVLMSD